MDERIKTGPGRFRQGVWKLRAICRSCLIKVILWIPALYRLKSGFPNLPLVFFCLGFGFLAVACAHDDDSKEQSQRHHHQRGSYGQGQGGGGFDRPGGGPYQSSTPIPGL